MFDKWTQARAIRFYALTLLIAMAAAMPAVNPRWHDHPHEHGHGHHNHALPTPLPKRTIGKGEMAVTSFDLAAVRLNPGSAFGDAQQLNTAYLRYLDLERLLHTFRAQAGLPNSAPPYGGWESPNYQSGLLNGHFTGHLLSALAFAAAAGEFDLRDKGAQLVAELAQCQAAYAKSNPALAGWLSAYGIDQIERLEAHNLTSVWAPYYTIHKIMAGLYDQHMLTGNQQALSVLIALADFLAARIARLIADKGNAWWQECLDVEFGGMNEVAYNLYALTMQPTHAQLAAFFSPDNFFSPLATGTSDPLDGLHANQHLPIIVGAARGSEVIENSTLATISLNFDCLLRDRYTYTTGGSNVNEHWSSPNQLGTSIITSVDPETHAPVNSDGYHTQETCTTYNALKLTRKLFEWSPTVAAADGYETKLLNGILGVQQPGVMGSLSYMTPLGRGVNRNRWDWYGFGSPDNSFWCCYGTTIESFAKLGDSIYFRNASGSSNSLWVSQFIPSTLTWDEHGLRLNMTVNMAFRALSAARDADASTATLTVHLEFEGVGTSSSLDLDLHVRVPGWAAPGSTVRVQRGTAIVSEAQPPNGTFYAVPIPTKGWQAGDVVELALGMLPRLAMINDERAPYTTVASIMLGPLLLAGVTDESDVLHADPARVAQWVVPRPAPCASYRHSRRLWLWASSTDSSCEDAQDHDIELVAIGADRNYTLLPLSSVALQNYTAFFNVTG